jgi:hypothetical protein
LLPGNVLGAADEFVLARGFFINLVWPAFDFMPVRLREGVNIGRDLEMNIRFPNSLTVLIPENWDEGFSGSDDNLKCKMFIPKDQPSRKEPTPTERRLEPDL